MIRLQLKNFLFVYFPEVWRGFTAGRVWDFNFTWKFAKSDMHNCWAIPDLPQISVSAQAAKNPREK